MTTLAAIRTHRWGPDETRLHAQLAPVFGDRLVVVFHNRPAGLVPPVPVVDLTDAWVAANGLRAVQDYGWRCGDYCLYALRTARPGFDRYWLIEPDVAFTGPVAEFFARADALAADALCYRPTDFDRRHRFARTMPSAVPLRRAIFALTRFSGRAIDRLLPLRRAYSAGGAVQRNFTNDEIFAFSHLSAMPDLTVADMAAALPDWFAGSAVETDPDMLDAVLAGRTARGVFHPVRTRASFAEAVARRVAGNGHFLAGMRPSLALLDEGEIEALAADIAARVAAQLRQNRAAGLAAADEVGADNAAAAAQRRTAG